MTQAVGVSAFAWTATFEEHHLALLPNLRKQGFAAFEVPMFHPAALPVSAIRKTFASSGLACTVCAILPEGVNPISPDAAIRRRSVAHLVECIETAAAMGARLIGGPLLAPIGYLPQHRPTPDEWTWAVEALEAMCEPLDRHDVTLAIEPVNRSETFFLRNAADALRLCEAIAHPRIGVTIDTFHANIEEKSTPAAIALLGPYLKHMHLSENDRSLLGQGHIDFPAILQALQSSRYDGWLMIEGFGYSQTETTAPGYLWADSNVSPDRLASEGLRYLHARLQQR